MRRLSVLLATGLLALAGCGDDDDDSNSSEPVATTGDTAMTKDGGAIKKGGEGTTITVGESEFGEMLFDANDQAIYIFENDREDESVCYDDCAEAWPPVLTEGEPKAGDGVDKNLLRTVARRDGQLQVTYNGKPLYFYAHEGPGEVKCHNVELNGGLWWVVGPDGERRP